jgi:RNA polymerase sigma-70 factor, ECF subfamily
MTARPSTTAIWSRLSGDLRPFIRRRVADDHLADDLLQETFLRIHRGIDRLKDVDRLPAWVHQIARNVIHDHYRKAPGAAVVEAEIEAAPAENSGPRACLHGCDWLDELIHHLPDKYREAVRLSVIEHLPQQEVADRLGLSLSGAKSRIQRGRKMIKELLDQCCTFEFDRRGNLVDYDPKPERTVCRNCDDREIAGSEDHSWREA